LQATFVVGGETLTAETLAFWRTNAPQARFINEYGPTETVVGCCVYEVDSSFPSGGRVPIGAAAAGAKLYVLDDRGAPVEQGEVGELYVGGPCVTLGYLGAPGNTAEKYVPDPFSQSPGQRLYRTGDFVHQRADGALEFLGRRDGQVKVRGYRIELGEIEVVMAAQDNVRQAAVTVTRGDGTDAELVAYVVPRRAPFAASALRTALRRKLPAYMVPGRVRIVPEMPLTPNGKIDRAALPAVADEADRAAQAQRIHAADGAHDEALVGVETEVAALFAAVLGVPSVAADADFFEVGGNSLRAVRVLARIKKRFRCSLTIPVFFEARTATEVAVVIAQRMAETRRAAS
ncbi:MAG: non-ribosomal peptide synthetase, partial [Planctomycetota bacterium]